MNSKFRVFIFIPIIFSVVLSAQPPSDDYRIVFCDNFDDGLITNLTWWNDDCTTYEGDAQWYMEENIIESNGTLKLISKDETITCNGVTKDYTSAYAATKSTTNKWHRNNSESTQSDSKNASDY